MWKFGRAKRRLESVRHRELAKAKKAVAEFYAEVALKLHLPRKAQLAKPLAPRLTREEALREIRGGTARFTTRRVWLPVLALLLLVLTGAYYAWPATKLAVPQEFLGIWMSRNPGYVGRRIAISTETVEIIAGRGAATGPVAVTSAKLDTTSAGIRLRVVYGKGDNEQKLEITLHPGKPPTLTLLRPANVIWERVDDSRATPPGT